MSSVQFYGVDKVLEAYNFKKIPAWSMWNGRAMLHSCETDNIEEGAAELQTWLDMMADSNSIDRYTLKVYKDVKTINEKTPCNGSFNFRLVDEDTREQTRLGYAGGSRKMIDEMKVLREELDELRNGGDIEEDNSIAGRIGNVFIDEPEKVPHIINAIKSVLAMLGINVQPGQMLTQMPMMQQPVAISGVNDESIIIAAIDKLKVYDIKLPEHLTKLARIAETDKASFTMLLTMLDNINV